MKGLSDKEIRGKYSEETQDLKDKLRSMELLLKDYKKAHGSISNFFNSLKDSIPIYPQEKIKYSKPTSKVKHTIGAVLHITDTHYGAVQASSEIEGFGEYSPEICEKRCMDFIAETKNWVKAQRSAYHIPTAHVLVTGDLVSGDIQRLTVTNAFPTPQQVIGSARILASQLSKLSEWFETVQVHFIVDDNHGRLTVKPQAKEAGINNWNYLVGEFAKIMVSSHENINFNVYPQTEVVVRVESRNYLLMHGHGIRGWMGIPYYSVERKAAKEAMKRMNVDGKRFNKIIMGHFHHPISHPDYFLGGSTQGTDAYDHQCGRNAEPSQSAWLVGKHGEFNRIDFKL